MLTSFLRTPLHERIANDLRGKLAELPVGTKVPKESELAARYDVSVPTLRIAMTILVREGLVNRKHGSGTYVAKPLVATPGGAAAGRVVGLSVAQDALADPCSREFVLRILDALLNGLEEQGITYRLFPARESADMFSPDCLQFVRSPEAAGIIFTSSLPERILSAARERGIPCFGLGANQNLTVSTGIKYAEMVRASLAFFRLRGRNRPALLAWNPDDTRLLGMNGEEIQLISRIFKSQAKAGDFIARDRWICTDLHPSNRAAGWSGLREIWSATSQKPDALLVSDSKLLPGVLEAIRDLRIRVPEDLLILSHSNMPEDTCFPPQIARMEYQIADWAEPLLDGVRRAFGGQVLEPLEVEVPGRLIEPEVAEEELRLRPFLD